MTKISFTQTVTGQDRKTTASVIAEALGTTASYSGPPSFGYAAGSWGVSKNSQVVSPQMDIAGIREVKAVMTALSTAGLNAEGTLLITIHGISEDEARILVSVLKSKESLLKKSLQTDESLAVLFEEEKVTLPFFMETLNADSVCACLTLAMKLAEFSRTLKYTSATEKAVDNEKYALRCFLLRLGFIGPEFKTERKTLLASLEGNTAFKVKAITEEASAE